MTSHDRSPDAQAHHGRPAFIRPPGSADPEVVDDPTGDGADECGQGQTFPDDPDFREAVCRSLLAMVDLIGTDAEIEPEWNTRSTTAILD